MNIDAVVTMLREVFGAAAATPESAVEWLNAPERESIVALLGDVRDAVRARRPGASVSLRRSANTYEVVFACDGRSWATEGDAVYDVLARAALAAWREEM